MKASSDTTGSNSNSISKDQNIMVGSFSQDEDSEGFGDSTHMDNLAGAAESQEEAPQFTKTETRMVECSKMLVYLAIALAAAVVSTATYLFMKDQEEKTMVQDVS